MLAGGNLATEVLFATALGLFARGLGADISLADLLVINISVSLFATLHPGAGRHRRHRVRAHGGPHRRGHERGGGACDRAPLPLLAPSTCRPSGASSPCAGSEAQLPVATASVCGGSRASAGRAARVVAVECRVRLRRSPWRGLPRRPSSCGVDQRLGVCQPIVRASIVRPNTRVPGGGDQRLADRVGGDRGGRCNRRQHDLGQRGLGARPHPARARPSRRSTPRRRSETRS